MEKFFDFLEIFKNFPEFDLLYLLITIYFIYKGARKGFISSLLSASKWILAYIVTIYLFPKTKPYVEGIIDSEYVLDILLGISLFVLIIFIIMLVTKGISKAITFTGLGKLDKFFGFILGFAKGYVFGVCLFTAADIIYDHKKWSLNLDDSITFPWVEKGSIYLIKGFPNKKEYEDAKEKVQDL
tara:strand:- start:416 stop:967 length:552 start_codon:yes stop_codon:yes gene_type:complete